MASVAAASTSSEIRMEASRLCAEDPGEHPRRGPSSRHGTERGWRAGRIRPHGWHGRQHGVGGYAAASTRGGIVLQRPAWLGLKFGLAFACVGHAHVEAGFPAPTEAPGLRLLQKLPRPPGVWGIALGEMKPERRPDIHAVGNMQ